MENLLTNGAICVIIDNIKPHPNADRLQLTEVCGQQVVVGLDTKLYDKMVYFDANLYLTPGFAASLNLYNNSELNKDTTIKGYLGKQAKVKTVKLRGEISNGLLLPIGKVFRYVYQYTGTPIPENEVFTHVGSVQLCYKYILPVKRSIVTSKKKGIEINLPKHWDTPQAFKIMKKVFDKLDGKSLDTWVEEKIHGTSGRTGKIEVKVPCWWRKLLHLKLKKEMRVVSGTRRVNNINNHIPAIRKEIEDKLRPNIKDNEVIYYEIFGYAQNKPIQPGFVYDHTPGKYSVLIYRITQDGKDLSRERVRYRAFDLGMISVNPTHFYIKDYDRFKELIIDMANKPSEYDVHRGLREGVVIWFKIDDIWMNCKYKSDAFWLTQGKTIDVEDVL